MNQVNLLGNLTRDPELKHLPSGSSVCNFGIAVNETYRDSQGESRERTTFVDCVAWGRQGEVITEYLSKGRRLLVEGRLQLDQWQDRNGDKRSKLKVVVHRFHFVDSREAPRDQKLEGPVGPEDDIPF